MTNRVIFPTIKPYPHQKKLYDDLDSGKWRNFIYMLHRQGGKGVGMLNWVNRAMATQTLNVVHIFPEATQATRAVWENTIQDLGIKYIDMFPKSLLKGGKPNEVKKLVTYKHNNSNYFLTGAQDIDAVRGFGPKIIILDEFAFMQYDIMHVLAGVIAKHKSYVIILTTANGKNEYYDLYNTAIKSPNLWNVTNLTVDDTFDWTGDRIVTQEEIDRIRATGIPEEWIQQEFYNSFNSPRGGAPFGELLFAVRAEGRLKKLPFIPTLPVHMAWDFGLADSTVVIFFQRIGNEARVINWIEGRFKTLSYYIEQVSNMRCPYTNELYGLGINYIPHDGKNRNYHSGVGNVQKLLQSGLMTHLIPKPDLVDTKINLVQDQLPFTSFDETEEDGIRVRRNKVFNALESTSFEYKPSVKTYRREITEGWNIHFFDAFAILAAAEKENRATSLIDTRSLAMTCNTDPEKAPSLDELMRKYHVGY